MISSKKNSRKERALILLNHALRSESGHKGLSRWGSANPLQRYRCSACRKTCNALTGTPLAHLRHKGRWLTYCECLREGGSVREGARRCGIDKTTAFRWRHRFLRRPTQNKASTMVGIVEADETFFRESAKGSRRLCHRPARKRGIERTKAKANRVPVLVVRDRTGSVADFVFERIEKEAVHACLKPLLSEELVLRTDGNSLYSTFAK
ncbi:MAG: IS1595 family transposase, partial [Gammaproteobacteria bacterium]